MRKKKWPDKRSKKFRMADKHYKASPWYLLKDINFTEYEDEILPELTGYGLYLATFFFKGENNEEDHLSSHHLGWRDKTEDKR